MEEEDRGEVEMEEEDRGEVEMEEEDRGEVEMEEEDRGEVEMEEEDRGEEGYHLKHLVLSLHKPILMHLKWSSSSSSELCCCCLSGWCCSTFCLSEGGYVTTLGHLRPRDIQAFRISSGFAL